MKHNKKLRTVQALEQAKHDSDDDDEEGSEKAQDDKNVDPSSEGDQSDEEDEGKAMAETLDVSDDEEDEDRYRDQGFTRPRLLILCPMRKAALEVMCFSIR